jgi:hypothetical protein
MFLRKGGLKESILPAFISNDPRCDDATHSSDASMFLGAILDLEVTHRFYHLNGSVRKCVFGESSSSLLRHSWTPARLLSSLSNACTPAASESKKSPPPPDDHGGGQPPDSGHRWGNHPTREIIRPGRRLLSSGPKLRGVHGWALCRSLPPGFLDLSGLLLQSRPA